MARGHRQGRQEPAGPCVRRDWSSACLSPSLAAFSRESTPGQGVAAWRRQVATRRFRHGPCWKQGILRPDANTMATLVLVEDDPGTRTAMQLMLEHAGHRVLAAEHGVAALAAMSAERPDCVITDWAMPLMDGLKLCRHIRADPKFAALPVVLISASACPPAPRLWNAFLRKPVTIQQIERTIRTLLGPPGTDSLRESRQPDDDH